MKKQIEEGVAEALYEAAEKHNMQADVDFVYSIVVSGKHRFYYTLWIEPSGWNPKGPMPRYVKNITSDIVKLTEFIKRLPGKVEIYSLETFEARLDGGYKRYVDGIARIGFGKYRGKSMAEIFEVDPKYVMWFRKEYKTKPYTDRYGREKMPRITEHDESLRRDADELARIFFDQMTERNRESHPSQHIGTLKERRKFEVVITSVKDTFEESVKKLVGKEAGTENLVTFYEKDEAAWGRAEVGQTISLTGTIADHKESVGRKVTYLNRVK